jgi:hypothetical protein
MKKITLLLAVLTIAVSINGQWYKSNNVKALTLITASITLDAVGDGLTYNGKPYIGKAFNVASYMPIIAAPIIIKMPGKDWLKFGVSFISLRSGLYAPTYNMVTGHDILYNDDLTPYRKLWDVGGNYRTFEAMKRSMFVSFGIYFTLNGF